jgi:hypothetical protein
VQTVLGFVWLYANAEGAEEVQLFEGLGIGAVDGSFIAIQEVEARAVGKALERAGDTIVGFGYAMDVGEKAIDVIDAGQNFVGEEGGFDVGEAAQAPAGGGHVFDQLDFDGTGGDEFVEIGVEEALEVGGRFVGEDYGDGREGGGADGESVAKGVLGGTSAAGGGRGAVGFGAVGAGGDGFFAGFGFRVSGHIGSGMRVAGGGLGGGWGAGEVVEGMGDEEKGGGVNSELG